MPLKTFHLTPADYLVQRWKNGKGETKEIAVDAALPFRWRVSWARVPASGPFSSFENYDRIIVMLTGGVVTFTHDESPKRIVPRLVPYPFKGEWKTEATLSTGAEDFNVFALRGKAKAGVYPTFLSQDEDMQFPLMGQEHFLFCVEGTVEILDPNTGGACELSPGETFRVSRETPEEYLNLRARGLDPKSVCLWVVVHLTPSIS